MTVESTKYRALESLRGVCAILVALYHIGLALPRANLPTHFSRSFFAGGWVFVDFFFVLSGFIIFANYEEKLRDGFGVGRFMILRFGRVYPLHFFLIVVALIGAWLSHAHVAAANIIGNVLLLHGLGLMPYDSLNQPSWSISVEFYAYLFFAGVIVLSGRFLPGLLVAIMVVAGGFLLATHPADAVFLLRDGMPRCLYEFAAGALTWKIFVRWRARTDAYLQLRWRATLVEAALCGITIGFVALPIAHYNSVLRHVPLFAAAIFLFAFERGAVSRILMLRPFLVLGLWSYSIYMDHFLVAKYAMFRGLHPLLVSATSYSTSGAIPSIVTGDAIGTLYIAMVVACAGMTYHTVEEPARRWFKGKINAMT